MVVSDEVLNRDFGSSPLRLLLMSLSTWRDELFAKDSGMLPVISLFPRSTYLREKLLPRDGGISSVSLLLVRTSACSLERFPKAEGILPCKFVIREVKLAMQGDMVPLMPSDERSIAMIRGGLRALQVTPSQLQKFKDVLLHEDRTLDGPES
uniref:Uncharacterized protein n=1 Tax=Oryza glumipatula TaxID=40148 RepID=A0A0E0ABC5_9ORYZ